MSSGVQIIDETGGAGRCHRNDSRNHHVFRAARGRVIHQTAGHAACGRGPCCRPDTAAQAHSAPMEVRPFQTRTQSPDDPQAR